MIAVYQLSLFHLKIYINNIDELMFSNVTSHLVYQVLNAPIWSDPKIVDQGPESGESEAPIRLLTVPA